MTRTGRTLIAAALAWSGAGAALAHPGHAGHEMLGVLDGLVHPWSGLDHVLAMTAVGLWAALRGGRDMRIWPAAFLAAMALGFVAPALDVGWVEMGVIGSVVGLGAFTALNRRGSDVPGLAVVSVAGMLHGMAHAADIGPAAPGFAVGMLLSTAALHAIGLGMALSLRRLDRQRAVQLIGAGVAGLGLLLAIAP